jgi:hypothetical protein
MKTNSNYLIWFLLVIASIAIVICASLYYDYSPVYFVIICMGLFSIVTPLCFIGTIFRFRKIEKCYTYLNQYYDYKLLSEEIIRDAYKNHFTPNDYPFIAFLEKMKQKFGEDKRNDRDKIAYVNNIIRPIIEKEKEKEPFLGVNDKEKRWLISISDSMKAAGVNSAEQHLYSLSEAIKERQIEHKRTIIVERISLAVSILGLIVTLLMYYFETALPKRDAQVIEEYINSTLNKKDYIKFEDLGNSK